MNGRTPLCAQAEKSFVLHRPHLPSFRIQWHLRCKKSLFNSRRNPEITHNSFTVDGDANVPLPLLLFPAGSGCEYMLNTFASRHRLILFGRSCTSIRKVRAIITTSFSKNELNYCCLAVDDDSPKSRCD